MQNTFYFGFRYEKKLGDRIRKYCRSELISINCLVHRVLARLCDLHDEGRMDLFEPSRFRMRSNKSDRESTSLVLKADRREMLRNLAFAYRISMAEVVRIGLEMFLDFHGHGKLDETIHVYRAARNLIHTVIFFLYPILPKDDIPYPLLI